MSTKFSSLIPFLLLFISGCVYLNTEIDKEKLTYPLFSAILAATVLIRYAWQSKFNIFIRNFSLWILILITTVALYTYRNAILNSKLASELLPIRPIQSAEKLILTRKNDGAFHMSVKIKNANLDCIIDTGATKVLIDYQMAQKADILKSEALNYSLGIMTANGVSRAAKIYVDEMIVGNSINIKGSWVYVNQASMDVCLLGMSFLSRLKSFTIEGDTLVINP